MKQLWRTIAVLLIFVPVILLVGCDGDHHMTPSKPSTNISDANKVMPQITQIYPPDGAVGVATTSQISMAFNMPMDTSSVNSHFFMAAGEGMYAWMDSSEHYMQMNHMGMVEMDAMLAWMDSFHIAGQFNWNETMDSCLFIPDSMLNENMEYMIYTHDEGMMSHGSGMMGMSDHGEGNNIYHFETGTSSLISPQIMTIWPQDSLVDICPMSNIHLTFNMPMDTSSVMSSIHLMGGEEMHIWMDSLAGMMSSMGNMGMNMEGMISWMVSIEHSGHFNWNDQMDSLEFIPESSLHPYTDYMLYMNVGMHAHDGTPMDMNSGADMGQMIYFQTGQYQHQDESPDVIMGNGG